MPAAKLDLYKLHKAEYIAPRKPVLIQMQPARYLVIEDQGAPGGERFTACIGALYGVAFTLKMARKVAGKQDYTVCKLEGQWFFEGDPASIPKEKWKWKFLIRTPDFISQKDLESARATLLRRGKGPDAALVRLEIVDEGDCVQALHTGPYDKACETIALMQAFAEAQGLKFKGTYHEVYLSDPRRVAPERLRTILRHPVSRST